MGLSVDSLFAHLAWINSIRERFAVQVAFPIIEDPSMAVAHAYGMLHPDAHSSATVRASFIIDPHGIIRAITWYPIQVGRSVEEPLRLLMALQTSDAHEVYAPEGWHDGDPALAARADEVSARLKLLGNPQRLLIVCLLCEGEYSVGAIEERLSLRQPNLSQQLAALREAGAIEGRREAKAVIYFLADERIRLLVEALHAVFCPDGVQTWSRALGQAPAGPVRGADSAARFARVLERESAASLARSCKDPTAAHGEISAFLQDCCSPLGCADPSSACPSCTSRRRSP